MGTSWALTTNATPLQEVGDVGWVAWSSYVVPVETLGTQISSCRCMASSGPPKKVGIPLTLFQPMLLWVPFQDQVQPPRFSTEGPLVRG